MTSIRIECSSCGKHHHYECDNFLDWKCLDSDERQMGAENHYQASFEDSCDCSQTIEIIFNCWEYPIGVVNHTDVEINGAVLLENNCSCSPDLSDSSFDEHDK